MTPLVSTKVLEDIRARKGEPRVSWPEGSASYPLTERVVTVPRSKAVLAFGAAEPDSTRFPNSVLTAQEETKSDGHNVEMYRRYEVLPGPVLTTQLDDSETMTPVLITRQRILTPSFPLAQTAGSDIRFEPANAYWGTKTTTTIVAAGAGNWTNLTRTVDDYQNFPFPSLITSVTPVDESARDGTVSIRLNWTRREGFEALAKVQSVVTYHATKAAADAAASAIAYAPIFNHMLYDGHFYNVNNPGVLNDEITIPEFTTGTENPKWGYVVEPSVTFAASTPSATQYLALVGSTPRVIGVDVKPWKYNLWRKVERKVILR